MKPLYLYISPFFPTPESWRGGYALDFVHALRDSGRYDVRVLVPGRGPDYTLDGIPVIRFREWRLPSMVLPFLFVRRNAAALLRTLRDHAIDPAAIAVCHANTPFVAPYALALRARNPHVRAILHHHFLDFFALQDLAAAAYSPKYRHQIYFLKGVKAHILTRDLSGKGSYGRLV